MPDDPEKTQVPDDAVLSPAPRPISPVAKWAVVVTLLPLVFLTLLFTTEVDGLAFGVVVCAILAPLFSVAAIIHILKSKSRGMAIAITSLVFSISYIVIPTVVLPCLRQLVRQIHCGTAMTYIGRGIAAYQHDFNGRFPDPNKWCDLLIEHADISPRVFSLDAYKEGVSFVALNPDATPDSSPDTVLVFECRTGWNQHGGPELFDPNRHQWTGCVVLFKDMHVEFVKGQKHLKSLHWSPDANSPPPKVGR
jgi:hypothetical protein